MSKKDKDKVEKKDEQLDNEPWEQPIYEEGESETETENSDPSRKNRRSKTDGKNWYAISLITLLFLIVIVATFLILYFKVNANMNTKKEIVQSSSLIVEKSDVTSETSSSTKESSTVESSTVVSSATPESSTVPSSSTFADVEVSPNDVNVNQQNAENANVAAQENQTPAAPTGGASVNVGENGNINLYRIAKNNGLTVDEVMQLNPGIDSQNLQPGQAIRIK